MKVLMLNGSPRSNGNTALALQEMAKVFADQNIESEIVQVGHLAVPGCTGCGACAKLHRCVRDDLVNQVSEAFRESDGLVIGSPVYYASANGTLVSLLDRLFMCSNFDKRTKVGACVVAARRGGLSATFDQLNKYFTISGMPVASSQYWNSIHGGTAGEAVQDEEGLQIMRTLAANMSFLMRSVRLGAETFGLPEQESRIHSNFIR